MVGWRWWSPRCPTLCPNCTWRYTLMRHGGLEADFLRRPTPNSMAQCKPYQETRWHFIPFASRIPNKGHRLLDREYFSERILSNSRGAPSCVGESRVAPSRRSPKLDIEKESSLLVLLDVRRDYRDYRPSIGGGYSWGPPRG